MRERRWPSRLRGLEPWLCVPMLLSLAASGVAPMLMPLEVLKIEGRALHVGVVMAAVGAGLLTAPLWGQLANRRLAQRRIVVGGSLAIAASTAAFGLAREVHEWGALAFVMGAGAAAVFTVANVLISEGYPAGEQNAVLAWLQTLATVGTMLGLVIAGGVSHLALDPAYGFAIAGGLAFVAALIGMATIPARGLTVERNANAGTGPPPAAPAPAPAPAPPWAASLRPFSTLLVLWTVASLGANAVGALYPLLMRLEFHVEPAVSSFYLAGATGLQALLFVPAGTLSARRGELRVLQGGLALRLVCLGLLALMAVTPVLERPWLAFLPYGALVLAWPLLSISSNLLSSRLGGSTGSFGIGLFNAGAALAGLAGPVLGGHAADTFGYTSVWLLAAASVGLALLLTFALVRQVTSSPHPSSTAGTDASGAAG